MRNKPKYLNYAGLYLKRGTCFSMRLEEDYTLAGEGRGSHIYVAPVFDSGEEQESWQSFRLEGEFHDCKLEVVVAAADEDYRGVLEDAGVSLQDKEELIRGLSGIRRVNARDILLTRLKGRYLYSFWKVSGREDCRFRIEGARVEFPENSFLQYFPEVYQTREDFFQRYISIFQTMYMNLEREVDRLPIRLDYEKADQEDLLQLAGWIGLDEIIIKEAVRDGNADRLRRLIAHAQRIQSGKGTKWALQLVLQLLYEERIQLLEYFKWYEYMEQRPEELVLYQKLYGRDSSSLTVLIEEREGREFSEGEKRNMQRVVACMLPIGMESNLIFLNTSYHMDTHCYLNRNSVLASPVAASADGMELHGNVVLQ